MKTSLVQTCLSIKIKACCSSGLHNYISLFCLFVCFCNISLCISHTSTVVICCNLLQCCLLDPIKHNEDLPGFASHHTDRHLRESCCKFPPKFFLMLAPEHVSTSSFSQSYFEMQHVMGPMNKTDRGPWARV